MSQLGLMLQESRNTETETITILGLLREQMEGVDGRLRRKKTLKERLGFGCCGTRSLPFGPTAISIRDDNEEEEQISHHQQQLQAMNFSPDIVSPPSPIPPIQNLAAALAAERQFRTSRELERNEVYPVEDNPTVRISTPGTPLRVSLMRLLELTTDRGDQTELVVVGTEKEIDGSDVLAGCDSVCCVCMVRKKGAAFIPCGHTFCRLCSREVWLTRGSCPLCNRPILEVLDLF